jgi:LmbE family N-acetylglucosaminyl deacetylase
MFQDFKRVLVVAPHPDDETLGAGGTIRRLADEGHDVTVAVMTGRGEEAHPLFDDAGFAGVRAEFDAAMAVLGVNRTLFANLQTTLLTETPVHLINKRAADVVAETRPDLILLPFEHDLHKDHGLINYAFMVALRPHLSAMHRPHMVACYETPSETHLQAPYLHASFEPHMWVDVSAQLSRKLEALTCFKSQISSPGLRSLEALSALAHWRGAQIGRAAAEAFVVIRQSV